jgi:hypothetical protein
MAIKKQKQAQTNDQYDKFYKRFSDMAKVNFLGFVLEKHVREKIIGKDSNSIEYAELKAILDIFNDKFQDRQ